MASSSTAWQWVIEALADLKQVQTPILKALITRIPNFLNEAPESLREHVALRYLEEIAGDERDNSAAFVSGSEIDPGLSPEEVLCNHWRKVANSGNPKKDGHEASYRHGLRQYILQKKSTLPKCSLELLKESILDGAHEDAASMKDSLVHERSKAKDNPLVKNSEENQRVKRLKASADFITVQSLGQHSATLPAVNGNVTVSVSLQPGKQLQSSELRKDFQEVSDSGNRILHNNIVDTCAIDNHLLEKSSTSQPSADADGDVLHVSSDGNRRTTNSPPIRSGHCDDDTNIARDDCEPSVVRETPPTRDAIYDTSPNFHPINKMLAAEKQRLLSSQISANLDSFTGEFTEQGLCIKCDKGGQLLCCNSSGCSIAVHDSCLGSEVTFDEMGLFFCPFCSYTRSYNAYRKAKKIFSRARKALSIFIGKDLRLPGRALEAREGEYILRRRQDCSLNPILEEDNIPRAEEQPTQTDAEGLPDEAIRSSKIDGHASKRQLHNQIDRDKTPNSNKEPNNDSGSSGLHGIAQADRFRIADRIVNDNECVGLPEHGITREPHAGSGDGNLPCNMEDTSTAKGKDVAGVVDDRETMQVENQEQESLEHESNSQSDDDPPTLKATERHTKKRKVAATVNNRQTPGTPQRSKSVKHSKNSRPKRYSNPVVPNGRRTKLLWTAEEEEALKIAVQKFAANSDGCYPWTKILEFGRHVFHKTRQPGDLKDKWRNIKIKEGSQQKQR